MIPTLPNLFIFIHAIKQQHACSKINKPKGRIGDSPPKRKSKYIRLEERIQKAFDKQKLPLGTLTNCAKGIYKKKNLQLPPGA